MNSRTPSAVTDPAASEQLIAALCDAQRYPHPVAAVLLLETHLSWVLLAGRYAYKIKKPVDLGFVDFTRLSDRHFFCQEELRLNRRLAPMLYLDVIAIGGTPAEPVLGAGPAIEYAVKMNRFAAHALADHLLDQGRLRASHLDQLAMDVARFHAGLAPATADSGHGLPAAIVTPARQNLDQLVSLLGPDQAELLAELRQATEQEAAALQTVFARRQRDGFVRECHGDLHLGNIVVRRGRAVPFDGIEFDPDLRWIDVMSDVAFLVMDLMHRGRRDLASRFLNAYLQASGDYAGLSVLRFYLAYRALVRAKIHAIRSAQDATFGIDECQRYLALARECFSRPRPALIITHGLPGSGKSSVSQHVVERYAAIRLRSDVERKRLFGLAAHDSSRQHPEGGIYGADATRQTYDRLLHLSRVLLGLGFTVIVDAAFLRHGERRQFSDLAQALAVPFAILAVRADLPVLRQRVAHRMEHGRDASEADLAVLERLAACDEPLLADEQAVAVEFVNDGNEDGIATHQALWDKLQLRIAPIANDIGA